MSHYNTPQKKVREALLSVDKQNKFKLSMVYTYHLRTGKAEAEWSWVQDHLDYIANPSSKNKTTKKNKTPKTKKPQNKQPGIEVHICNTSAWKLEARVQSQFQLYKKFEAGLGYVAFVLKCIWCGKARDIAKCFRAPTILTEKTWVQFLPSTWPLTTMYSSSPRGSRSSGLLGYQVCE